MEINRRRFPRLALSEDAIALDELGRELGKVSQASGGGMLIIRSTSPIADGLKTGQELTVTVVEPATSTSNTVKVIVRYHKGDQIGVEFIGGKQRT